MTSPMYPRSRSAPRSSHFARTLAFGIIGTLLLAVWLLGGLAFDDSIAEDATRKFGFSDPVVTERNWFMPGFRGCGEDDAIAWKVEATNTAGDRVTLTVCDGWFKSPTIRG